MARAPEIYIDLETDPNSPRSRIAIFGMYSRETQYVQLLESEITPYRIRKLLPRGGHLFTFNGEAFDLPIIETLLGIDLRRRYVSRDLRQLCCARGLVGGQKRIEQVVGWKRPVPPLGFFEQRALWQRVNRWKDSHALDRLLCYNRHDLDGMRWIRRKLSSL